MLEQIAISVFGVSAIWLSQDTKPLLRRIAPVLGLAGQPFWLYSSWTADQWGIFLLSIAYTVAWARGCRNALRHHPFDQPQRGAPNYGQAGTQLLRITSRFGSNLHASLPVASIPVPNAADHIDDEEIHLPSPIELVAKPGAFCPIASRISHTRLIAAYRPTRSPHACGQPRIAAEPFHRSGAANQHINQPTNGF